MLVVGVLDEAGMLGDLALVMSKAGINIDSVYVTTRGHIVLGVDDMAGAIQIAGGMAVMAFERTANFTSETSKSSGTPTQQGPLTAASTVGRVAEFVLQGASASKD